MIAKFSFRPKELAQHTSTTVLAMVWFIRFEHHLGLERPSNGRSPVPLRLCHSSDTAAVWADAIGASE